MIIRTVLIVGIALLVGCSDKNPTRAEWISIEKPPVRLIYVSQEPIADGTVHHLLQHIEKQPYRNYKFNDTIKIEVMANSHQTDIESDNDVTSLTIGRK